MRESVLKKIPINIILGQNEVDNKLISYREFGKEETHTVTYEEFILYINDRINKRI